MRCDQCKYWDAENVKSAKDIELRACSHAPLWWGATTWDLTKEKDIVRTVKPEFKDRKAFVQDGSDYAAWLYTTADFFCAHFEALDPAQLISRK